MIYWIHCVRKDGGEKEEAGVRSEGLPHMELDQRGCCTSPCCTQSTVHYNVNKSRFQFLRARALEAAQIS